MTIREFCRKGQHSCTPAVTLTFDNGARRLHWCSDHAADANRYRDQADDAPTAKEASVERFPSAEDVEAEAIASAADPLVGVDVVVMPIASAAAVSAALESGQIALLVSQDMIEATLAELAEASGVPLERVRAVHEAILNGEFPLEDGR